MSEKNSSNCDHDCSHCGADCGSREIKKLETNAASEVGKVIAVISGKGGVGKSTVTGLLAKELTNSGYKVGVLDADITGPSVPKMFGAEDPAYAMDGMILPNETPEGIKLISANMLLEDLESPVLWRGPILSSVLQQFYKDVKWGKLDYLLVDMPPGTGDVPLTVFQMYPVDGVIVVTTPQELVSMIVMKAVNMARLMNIPIIGAVENMSYAVCPKCGEKLEVFGESSLPYLEREKGLKALDALPIDAETAKLADAGQIMKTKTQLPKTLAEIAKL